MKKTPRKKNIVNKRASFNYEAVDDIEVGLVLTGEEVKAVRAGQVQLTGSYGRVLQGPKQPELWLVGAQFFGVKGDKQRSRKLLAHRSEIDRLIGLIGQKGYTLVPKKIYFKSNRAKLSLAISKGLKQHEKRHILRDRDIKREAQRAIRTKG